MEIICKAKLLGVCSVPDCPHGRVHKECELDASHCDPHVGMTCGMMRTYCIYLSATRAKEFKRVEWDT